MKETEKADLVLRRCKIMNCVLQGQSFSLGIMDSELGGRQTVQATMKAMSDAGLLSSGRYGTYILTMAGADAIAQLSASRSTGLAKGRSGNWQLRNKQTTSE